MSDEDGNQDRDMPYVVAACVALLVLVVAFALFF